MVKRSEDHKKPPADENAVLLFLGLATRAGKTVSGYDAVQQAVFAGAALDVENGSGAVELDREGNQAHHRGCQQQNNSGNNNIHEPLGQRIKRFL